MSFGCTLSFKVLIECCREKLGTFIFKFSDTVCRPTLMLIYNHPTLYVIGKCFGCFNVQLYINWVCIYIYILRNISIPRLRTDHKWNWLKNRLTYAKGGVTSHQTKVLGVNIIYKNIICNGIVKQNIIKKDLVNVVVWLNKALQQHSLIFTYSLFF